MTTSRKILNIVTIAVVVFLIGCTVTSVIIREMTQPKVSVVKPTEEYSDDSSRTLRIPTEALVAEGNRFYVYVVRSSIGLFGSEYHAEQIEVELFDKTANEVSGTSRRLSRHDEVIVPPIGQPVERLEEGCQVRQKNIHPD